MRFEVCIGGLMLACAAAPDPATPVASAPPPPVATSTRTEVIDMSFEGEPMITAPKRPRFDPMTRQPDKPRRKTRR